MKVVTARDMQTGPGPEDWFTGTVWRDAAPVGAPPEHRASTIEGQVARVADIIAYVNHDILDATRADTSSTSVRSRCRA